MKKPYEQNIKIVLSLFLPLRLSPFSVYFVCTYLSESVNYFVPPSCLHFTSTYLHTYLLPVSLLYLPASQSVYQRPYMSIYVRVCLQVSTVCAFSETISSVFFPWIHKCGTAWQSTKILLVLLQVKVLFAFWQKQRDGIYRAYIVCRNLWSQFSLAHFITH